MTKSTEALHALKRAANYSKLAMHNEGPRSFKRGQGALLKVVGKFGDEKKGITDKKLCRTLGWGCRETMAVAKKAADNGYVTITKKDGGKKGGHKHRIKLTEVGQQILEKRLAAEDRAADAVLSYLTDEEKEQLVALCGKVSDACADMGIDYEEIRKRSHKGHRYHQHVHRFGHHHASKKCCGDASCED